MERRNFEAMRPSQFGWLTEFLAHFPIIYFDRSTWFFAKASSLFFCCLPQQTQTPLKMSSLQ
ncbi:hypothetical protein ACE6H2_024277 [Prunus campanulata]